MYKRSLFLFSYLLSLQAFGQNIVNGINKCLEMNSQHFEHLMKYIFIVTNVYLDRHRPSQKLLLKILFFPITLIMQNREKVFQIKVVRLDDSYRSKEKLIYSSIKKTFAHVPFAHYINFVTNSEFITKLKRRYRVQNSRFFFIHIYQNFSAICCLVVTLTFGYFVAIL